jgi:hypothetical protein
MTHKIPIMIIMIPANAVQPIAHPLGSLSDMLPPLGFPPKNVCFLGGQSRPIWKK